ncbi:MAG: glycyl-radical enzyme activating protein [Chloroflexota bacterium]
MENTRGLVFHIIHGSFVDGHGIRTTVFLKGCPLRCLWCCNPEGQQDYPEIKFTLSLCDGCGRCLSACAPGALRLVTGEDGDQLEIDRARCTGCGACGEACSRGALELFGREMSVDEVFAVVQKDEPFYRASGGGVTIGGGEPTYQARFTLALLRRCRENYLHTAVDTCGYTTTREGFQVLEEADLLLFDLKGMLPEEHRRHCGVSNEVILDNLRRLAGRGKPLIIRVPVIPGYTDSAENIAAAAELLAKYRSVERVDLMAYHEYGMVKYGQLGRAYPLDVAPPGPERMADVRKIFEGYGLNVRLGG